MTDKFKKNLVAKICIFMILMNLFVAKINAEEFFPQINRFDISLNLYDAFCDFNSLAKTQGNKSAKFVGFCKDSARGYALDLNSRTTIATFGSQAVLANVFYLATDFYLAGNETARSEAKNQAEAKSSFIRSGFTFNAGFLYPLLADKGFNRFLISNRSQPINLNLLFELGFGYMVGVNSVKFTHNESANLQEIFNTLSPTLTLGMNMLFKDVPDLELEIAYKLAAGWRHNLYAKVQYDFLRLSENSSLGANILVDALWGSVNLGLGFKY